MAFIGVCLISEFVKDFGPYVHKDNQFLIFVFVISLTGISIRIRIVHAK